MAKKQNRGKSYSRKRGKTNKNRLRFLVVGGIVLAIILVIVVNGIFRTMRTEIFSSFNGNVFSDKYFVRGVDVSHHNTAINWNILREEDISFAYLKSTEGATHTDREYKRNYKLAKAAGLKVGTYHFFTFGIDGRQQAEHFIRSSKVYSGDIRPAIDVEHSPVNHPVSDKRKRLAIIRELRKLEAELFDHYGVRAVIYTNKECYSLYIKENFSDNPLWLCDLHDEPNVASDKWVIWQFSHTGNIPGVVGDIDLNFYRYSFSDFKNLLMP